MVKNKYATILPALLLLSGTHIANGQSNATGCYDELGCFPTDAPWYTLLRPLPAPLHPAEINVRLYCYTRESPKRYNITLWPKIYLEGCNFKPDRKTAFLVHGFASDGNASWLSDLKDHYLDSEEANFFIVDWGPGAKRANYLQVASNTRIVGAELGRFMKWLKQYKGMDPGDVHLMGHSLGAHICAYAAKQVPSVRQITAMDPAQPGFEGSDKTVRLDKEDAKFIDVIHTNALPFIPLLGLGFVLPVGHVDIYVNGGLRQPGCQLPNITELGEVKSITDLAKYTVEFIQQLLACSHGRSHEYFSQALRKDCYIWCKEAGTARTVLNGLTMGYIDPLFSTVQKCDNESCIPMGLSTPDFPARGVFAATTSVSYPFCETDQEESKRILREIKENKPQDSINKLIDGVEDGLTGVLNQTKEAAVQRNIASSKVAKKGKKIVGEAACHLAEAVSSITNIIG